MGRFCDTIVAVDGGYALYPGARPRSHPQQAEAIIQAAETADTELILHRPRGIWFGNEVEKRNYAVKLAATVMEPGVDWFCVVDADYHLLTCDPELIRAKLDATPLHVATFTLLDGKDFMTDDKLAAYVNTHDCDTEWTFRNRDLYRWNESLRIGPAHWTYSALIDGEWTWLRGPFEREAPALNLDRDLVFYHRTQDRPKVRKQAADFYYHARQDSRIEWMEHYEPSGVAPDGFADDQKRLWAEWAEQFADEQQNPTIPVG